MWLDVLSALVSLAPDTGRVPQNSNGVAPAGKKPRKGVKVKPEFGNSTSFRHKPESSCAKRK
jgi:hypothetical protein